MTKGSIALLGNMNNNFFTLARYLRDIGYAPHVFIFPYEPSHFRPETDTYSEEYESLVSYLPWGNAFDLLSTTKDQIRKHVGGYDYYLASGTGPAYLAKAEIRIDLFIPYGADLYDLPFFKIVRPTKLFHYFIFTRYQQKGIRTSRYINILDNSALFKNKLDEIRFDGVRSYSGFPTVYATQFGSGQIAQQYSKSIHYQVFKKIRDKYELVIFHHSRHCWKDEPDPISLKDNDKLLRGVAKFKEQSTKKVAIVTFEFGHDVAASKQLSRELKIETDVFWFPLMPRKEIMVGMSLCDIVAGEFRNSWFTYGVVFEAMALAKPVMHYRDDSLYRELELYPMIFAKTADDVANALETHSNEKLAEVGRQANDWYQRNVLEKSLSEISAILKK